MSSRSARPCRANRRYRRASGRARVRQVCLAIGPLSGVEPRLLADAYPSGLRRHDGRRIATRDRSNRHPRTLPHLRRGDDGDTEPPDLRELRRLAYRLARG